jgi:arginase
MPELRLITAPFHDGVPNVGMGAGAALLAGDELLRNLLAGAGWTVRGETIPAGDARRPEIARSMEVIRRLTGRVREARASRAFPVVLAGGCSTSLGTVSGLGLRAPGVVWLDAHADFDTPEDNISGFFDVFPLAMLTGSGWAAQCASIPGYRPLPEEHVVLGAVRDLEPYQADRLSASAVRVVPGELDLAAFAAALDALVPNVDGVYLHVDLDSLDVTAGRVNEYASPGGPSLEHLILAIDAVFDRLPIAAAALTAYDPTFDGDGRLDAAVRAVAHTIALRAAGSHG